MSIIFQVISINIYLRLNTHYFILFLASLIIINANSLYKYLCHILAGKCGFSIIMDFFFYARGIRRYVPKKYISSKDIVIRPPKQAKFA